MRFLIKKKSNCIFALVKTVMCSLHSQKYCITEKALSFDMNSICNLARPLVIYHC